jgi:hypothetical protein
MVKYFTYLTTFVFMHLQFLHVRDYFFGILYHVFALLYMTFCTLQVNPLSWVFFIQYFIF